MNDDQLQDILVRGFNSAPPHIQKFIQDGKVGAFVMSVQTSAQLHADVADDVSNQILLTLLGVLSPAELPEILKKEVGLSDTQVSLILTEANRAIFTPLRDELGKGSVNTEDTEADVLEGDFEPLEEIAPRNAPLQPEPSKPIPPPPSYAPPAPIKEPAGPMYDFSQPRGPIHTASPVMASSVAPAVTPAPAPIYTPPAQTAPAYTPPAPAPTMEPAQPLAPQNEASQGPTMRTMVSDVEQMKHGQTPHAYTPGATPTFAPTPVETVMPTIAPRDVASVPPPPKPAYIPAPAPHIAPPPPIPPIAQPPSQTPVPAHPPRRPEPTVEEVTHSLKQYGIDPYREPIE